MVNHGITTGALFICVGIIYERTHTREISQYGGIAKTVPTFSLLFIIVTLSSIGLPLTNGFTGEFLILSGSFEEALPIAGGPLSTPIFPSVVKSGVTPNRVCAPPRATRKPVMTSSKISRAPCSVHSSRSPSRNPG